MPVCYRTPHPSRNRGVCVNESCPALPGRACGNVPHDDTRGQARRGHHVIGETVSKRGRPAPFVTEAGRAMEPCGSWRFRQGPLSCYRPVASRSTSFQPVRAGPWLVVIVSDHGSTWRRTMAIRRKPHIFRITELRYEPTLDARRCQEEVLITLLTLLDETEALSSVSRSSRQTDD